MYVYIDESGNSGCNIKDQEQPFLYSLALLSPVDFDQKARDEINSIQKKLNVSELHAQQLGLRKIESIALETKDIIEKHNLYFYFTAVEKIYSMHVQLFECLFDSFNNPKSTNIIYTNKLHRDILFIDFISIVDDEIIYIFLEKCLMHNLIDDAYKNIILICNKLIEKIKQSTSLHIESKNIFLTALIWASKNPQEIFIPIGDKNLQYIHAPNFFAISILVPKICEYIKTNTIFEIIHDEQKQFKKLFTSYYSMMQKSKKFYYIKYEGWNHIDLSPIQGASFTMKPSIASSGLQLVDLILFLLKKQHYGISLEGNLHQLMQCVQSRQDNFECSIDCLRKSTVSHILAIDPSLIPQH